MQIRYVASYFWKAYIILLFSKQGYMVLLPFYFTDTTRYLTKLSGRYLDYGA